MLSPMGTWCCRDTSSPISTPSQPTNEPKLGELAHLGEKGVVSWSSHPAQPGTGSRTPSPLLDLKPVPIPSKLRGGCARY